MLRIQCLTTLTYPMGVVKGDKAYNIGSTTLQKEGKLKINPIHLSGHCKN